MVEYKLISNVFILIISTFLLLSILLITKGDSQKYIQKCPYRPERFLLLV
jgi:hypothetical protein